MFSLLSHASGLIGGRADERICIGRLTVDRVLIVLPVMAYSVGLGRPFRHHVEHSGIVDYFFPLVVRRERKEL